MKRHTIEPRPNWVEEVERFGMIYHHTNGQVYWNESAYYEFFEDEVDTLESATEELHNICLQAVAHVIEKGRWADACIPEAAVPLIKRSWDQDHPSIYGRFDLSYVPGAAPKMLEYNADTPTMLLEAAVIQWQWLQARFPKADQFNSIHERLIAAWKAKTLRSPLYFAHLDNVEDIMTVTYLRETAEQAGLTTEALFMPDIGWDGYVFRTPDGRGMQSVFKLYPWEWLFKETPHLDTPATEWMEPAWKMILSSKAILPILWELFPDHPNLLEAHLDYPKGMVSYIRKPAYGREGCDSRLVVAPNRFAPRGIIAEGPTGGYAGERPVYQRYAPMPMFDGQTVVIGSWVIDENPAGIGIRESEGPITVNESPFVPHLFTP